MNANVAMSSLKMAYFHKKCHQLLGSFAPRPIPGALPRDPTGARPPNSPYCSPTLNDLPPPVIKALSKYSVIIVIINLACKCYISVVVKGKVMPADDEQ